MTPARRTKLHAPTVAALNAALEETERRPEWAGALKHVFESAFEPAAIAALTAIYRQSKALDHVYGVNLEQFVRLRIEALVRAANGEPIEDRRAWVGTTPGVNWWRLIDNPLHLRADGAVEGAQDATPEQLLALHSYYVSLRPAGRPGRRSDADRAALAYRMHQDGAEWPAIARALGIAFEPYDRRSRGRAREKVRRLVNRGETNAE